MTWQESLERIYSPQFDAELNVVSGTNGFFRAVRNEPAVQDSLRLMRQEGELQEEVLGQIYDLTTQEVDPLYESPHDTPLAVLLWLIRHTGNDSALLGAQYVDRAPGCWYARKLAQQILHPTPVESSYRSVHVGDTQRTRFYSSSKGDSLNMVPPFSDVRVAVGQPRKKYYWSTLSDRTDWVDQWYTFPDMSEEDQTGVPSGSVVNYVRTGLNWIDAPSQQNTTRASGVVS